MPGPRLGAHMSIAGGVSKALDRGQRIGCETIQMFVGSPNRWEIPPLEVEEVEAFHKAYREYDIHPVVAHSSYLINVASPKSALRERSTAALVEELQRCDRLGIKRYVLHPGAHTGAGEAKGLKNAVHSLSQAIADTAEADVRILLETTAGQGSHLGYRFEHLAQIMDGIRAFDRLGVCLDTAHVWAAGYDLSNDEAYLDTWAQFEEIIGLGHLWAIHLNDSKRVLSSRVDRHEQLGRGHLGLRAFQLLVNDPNLRHIPMILETPKSPDLHEDVENLTLLHSMIDEQ